MLNLQAAFRKRFRKAGPGGPGYGPSRHPQSGKGMGVPGGVAKPGWATTEQPIPGGGSKKPVTPQVKPLPGMTPFGIPKKPTGKHKNMQAAVMKAVRMVAKHKDKRGSTAHHGKGGGQPRRQLSVPERHQLRIARDTMRMNPAMVAVAGGPDIEQSKKIIQELTGRPYNPRARDWEQRQQREEADIEQRHPKGRRGRERLQERDPVRNPWRN